MQGMFTGLLGNLSLLSYFVKKKETEVIVVQTLGVVSIYIVITQLAMAEAMPLPHFVATSVVVATGLVLNFFNYLGKLNAGIWRVWEDFITVTGLSALPQVRFFSLTFTHISLTSTCHFETRTLSHCPIFSLPATRLPPHLTTTLHSVQALSCLLNPFTSCSCNGQVSACASGWHSTVSALFVVLEFPSTSPFLSLQDPFFGCPQAF